MKHNGLLVVILAVLATAFLHLGSVQRRPGGGPPPPHDPPARILSLEGDRLELEARGGWRKTLKVDASTQVRRGRERGSRSDLRPGEMVIVYDVGTGEQMPEALLIDLVARGRGQVVPGG